MSYLNEIEGVEFRSRTKLNVYPTVADLQAARRAFGAKHALTSCIWDILEMNRNKQTAQRRLRELWDVLSPRALSLIKAKVLELEGDADFTSACEGLDSGSLKISHPNLGGNQ